MSFDEAEIEVASGRGGDGMVHFRREKYVPRGGPDGGDGGRGGDVVLEATTSLNTLAPFQRRSRFRAKDGLPGGPSNRSGKDAPDLVLAVPPGTQVREAWGGALLADLVAAGQRFVACRGGRGGRGNARFANSRRQAPRLAERGEPGESRTLRLELRLIADVGIVGLPNVGKSTLLAALTRAHPKIADYPFTTLLPNLGVHTYPDGETVLLADVPGLIEGAHRGAGLGTGFLRHVQRTRVLLHVVDGTAPDPLADFSQVNAELALFDPALASRPQVVALNKDDLPEFEDGWKSAAESFRRKGHSPHRISALAGRGLPRLMEAVRQAVSTAPAVGAEPAADLPVFRPEPETPEFEVQREAGGGWRVAGRAVERSAAMTYWEYDEAVRRFQRLLSRIGVDRALREAGVRPGDLVRIGEYELEWQE